MARVTVEDCVKEIPNRFELVAIAGQRANDISSGAPITVKKDNDKNAVLALREIAQGNLDIPKLREELINSLRTKSKVDSIEGENLHAEVLEELNDTEYTEQGGELLISESHADLDSDQIYSDDIIDEDER